MRRTVKPAGQAIFLHTGWRSAGTWLWESLRPLPDVCAYYEPLHEHLATLEPAQIETYGPRSWSSRHGAGAPYYREYAALLRLRLLGGAQGVQHYQPRFAFERFFLDPAEPDPELRAYIDHLLQGAAYIEQKPVLKFCRSMGRVRWMQRQFPDALHAVVLRHAVAQWHSARDQSARSGNRYFLAAACLVLTRNSAAPLVQAALARFGLRLPILPEAAGPLDHELCWRHMARLDGSGRQRIFVACWTVCAIAALACRQASIIDVDRLAASADYRRRIEAIFAAAGYPVTLAPAQVTLPHGASLDPDIRQAACALLADQALPPGAAALIEEKLGPGTGMLIPGGAAPVAVGKPSLPRHLGLHAYWTTMRASMPLRRLHGSLAKKAK